MTQDGIGATSVTVTAGQPSDSELMCTAVGIRPGVTIDWYHQTESGSETKITEGVSQIDLHNADDPKVFDVFDIVSTLQYNTSREYNGGTLKCRTTGQDGAETREDTAVMNVRCKWL